MKKLLSLFSLAVLTQLSLFSQSDLVITEINYNPVDQTNVEYLEIFNNGGMAIELKGVSIPRGGRGSMSFTFPAYVLNPGDYILIANDSVRFTTMYNLPAFEFSGAILNGGMNITLLDSAGLVLDSLTYGNDVPWVKTASREGCSIELCDPNTDNSLASSWERSTTYTGQIHRSRKMYGTPGVANSACQTSPIIHMRYRTFSVNENAGTVSLDVFIDNSNGSASSVKVKAVAGNADLVKDITFTSPSTVNFAGSQDEMIPFFFIVIDDTISENDETVLFILENVTNGILSNDTVMVTIRKDPNDEPVTRQMKLIGIGDDEAGGSPRFVEVMALSNITDMSIYGLGSANNGGGSDGVEFTFPATNAMKDSTYFISNDSARFHDFFGFAADFIDTRGGRGAISFNGNDAFELFENSRIIDTYGERNTDGAGEPWDYANGWAHRNKGTGPDDKTFVLGSWTFGGKDAFKGAALNKDAPKPYPLPEKPNSILELDENTNGVSVYPNPASNNVTVSNFKNVQSIVLVDLLGKTLETKTEILNKVTFDLSELNSGLYFIRINSNSGNTSVIKIIKE